MKSENKKVYFTPEMSVIEFEHGAKLLNDSCKGGICDTGLLDETVYEHDKA